MVLPMVSSPCAAQRIFVCTLKVQATRQRDVNIWDSWSAPHLSETFKTPQWQADVHSSVWLLSRCPQQPTNTCRHTQKNLWFTVCVQNSCQHVISYAACFLLPRPGGRPRQCPLTFGVGGIWWTRCGTSPIFPKVPTTQRVRYTHQPQLLLQRATANITSNINFWSHKLVCDAIRFHTFIFENRLFKSLNVHAPDLSQSTFVRTAWAWFHCT